MPRDNGGIDISTVGRPGGVPTHVTSRRTAAPGTRQTNIPNLLAYHANKPTTVDPFAFIGRARTGLSKALAPK